MRKSLTLVFGLFLLVNTLAAQPATPLMIKGYGKDIHLDHKVAPKEGIFAIGRMYNVHPKAIAAYNKLDMSKGLVVGQVIHIPLTDTNFSQNNSKGAAIYYIVGEKETLQKVSNVNNKVPVASLKEWNKLSEDKLATGKKLIVGFLVTGANAAVSAPVEKKETPKETVAATTNNEQEKTIAKTEPRKDEAIKTETKKEEPSKTEPKKDEVVKTESGRKSQPASEVSGQGYFKSFFNEQVKASPISKTETVTSGVFKMVNGGQEAKFYLLIDDVPSGTIVRIINPDNNRAVYAKVLGEMSGIRQNQGLNIRMSNSAASALGITDTDKFIVKVNY